VAAFFAWLRRARHGGELFQRVEHFRLRPILEAKTLIFKRIQPWRDSNVVLFNPAKAGSTFPG